MKTKQIDNWVRYVEVIPKRIIKVNGLDIPQMTDPYQGEVGLVITKNSSYENELICYPKHNKKKIILMGIDRFFIAEYDVLCGIELGEDYNAVDFMSQEWLDQVMDSKLNPDEDFRTKKYFGGHNCE